MLLFIIHLPAVFLIPIFDVRRYNGSFIFEFYIYCFQFPAHAGVLKSYLKLQEKDFLNKRFLEQKYIIFLKLSVFRCRWISSKVSKKAISFRFAFQVSHMCTKKPPMLFYWQISVYSEKTSQFYLARNKMAKVMEEVCEVGPKNLRKNFHVAELFSARNFSRFFPM